MKAAHHDSTASAPSQHPDPYLIDAEASARRAYHGPSPHTLPACQWSPAGLRILAVHDLPIGSKIDIGRGTSMLIGGSETRAFVRREDGQVETIELCELPNTFLSHDETFGHRLPVQSIDILARLGHLLAELEQLDPADPDDGIDEQTLAEARAMRERLGRRVAEVCGETFAAADPADVGQGQ